MGACDGTGNGVKVYGWIGTKFRVVVCGDPSALVAVEVGITEIETEAFEAELGAEEGSLDEANVEEISELGAEVIPELALSKELDGGISVGKLEENGLELGGKDSEKNELDGAAEDTVEGGNDDS